MASFEIAYDHDEDTLEVTFAVFDERFCRTVPLSDSAFLFTDLSLQAAWGLTIYGYADLLRVGETDLAEMPQYDDTTRRSIVQLLSRPPVSWFLDAADPEGELARVSAPSLERLINSPD
jgi:hypothetical protein